MKDVRIGIVGSRDWWDDALIAKYLFVLAELAGDPIIVSGGARGADSLGTALAQAMGLRVDVYLPDWDRFGRSAGYRRNEQIVDASHIILAFWDGRSRGTKHTIDIATARGMPVVVVLPTGEIWKSGSSVRSASRSRSTSSARSS